MDNNKIIKLKKSTIRSVDDFYLATYWDGSEEISTFLIKTKNNNGFYDFDRDCIISIGKIGYLEPLSKYYDFNEEFVSIKQAKVISLKCINKFNSSNIGKPKRWKPKVMLADTIPYLKVANSFADNGKREEDELNI